MDRIAEAAGVGKGTLYRRFGDRSGLALALLGERERDLQEAILRGPPPLGPGAPPRERLLALVDAILDLLDSQGDLLVASETASPGARYRGGPYAAWRQHAAVLLREARPDDDPDLLADLLLAPLAGDLHRHLRHERGLGAERLRTGLHLLVDALAGSGPDQGPKATGSGRRSWSGRRSS
jgi:AcrR family transcriptional regulator